MFINTHMKLKFKSSELQYFNWLFNLSPCFPLKASQINVITDPGKFYDTLCKRFQNASSRISVASLYIGTGGLEKKLLEVAKYNVMQKNNLQLKVLLDYQRGTRGSINSKSLLQEFLNEAPEQCNVFLYQTPKLNGAWSKALPSRYNEIIGLQHMKLYIADNSVILSGANCSNDYFSQRQDRYVEIEDADLADFYSELIDEMSQVSKKCDGDVILNHNFAKKELLVQEVRKRIQVFIDKWKDRQGKLITTNGTDTTDTWVFPLLQMGEYNVTQDEEATRGILSSAPVGSYMRLATGYFNLTEQYAKTLLQDCESNISLLMAHPNANGFLGAKGPAGGIPHAYSLIAKKFWQRVLNTDQVSRIKMLEYERAGWTFHAKGLWYYPPGSGVPWLTLVGSANLGERSVRRDLEAQAAILTASPDLQARLHDECKKLHDYSTECGQHLQERKVPLWVHATVGLFRTYF